MRSTQPNMAEALRLTRAGRLAEATALIRAGINGTGSGSPQPVASQPVASPEVVIDLRPTRVKVKPAAAAIGSVAEQHRASIALAPVSGSFEEHSYTGPAGGLAYRLYIPANATAGMPLLVMLHGCSQSPDDFARGTGMNRLADELGMLVAYPRQTQAANPQKCWNWFNPNDQRRDRGEPALIAGITRAVIEHHHADATRVYVAGLSAGGAAAAIMAMAYTDLYAAAGIHSGIACGAADNLAGALNAMRNGSGRKATPPRGSRFVPVITFHGDKDATVGEINSREIVAAALLAATGPHSTKVEQGRSSGGRMFTRSVSKDAGGQILVEQWTVHGLGHAWSGGDSAGSYTDPSGPDASREMARFFLDHSLTASLPS